MGRRRRNVIIGMALAVAMSGSFVAGRLSAGGHEVAATQLRSTGDEGSTVDTSSPDTTLDDGTTTSTGGDPVPSAAPATTAATARPAPAPAPAPAAPATSTTAAAPATSAAALDPGEPVCAAAASLVHGDVVGVVADDGIHEVSLDGSRDVLIPGTAPTAGGASMLQPAWSADGHRLAFVRNSATRQNRLRYAAQDLYVVDLERGCSRLLTRSGGDSFRDPSWSPDGSRLSYVRSVDGGGGRDGSMLETARDDGSNVVRVATGAMGGHWAPDGSGRIAFDQNGGLSVVDRNGTGKVTVLDDTPGGAEYESWSPDSTRVVYTVSVHQGIWVAAADGSGVRNLAPPSGNPNGIFWSRWSPDGRRLVFAAQDALWIIDADGANARKVATASNFGGGWWTPDGTAIVAAGNGGVVVTPIDGGTARVIRAGGTVVATFRRP